MAYLGCCGRSQLGAVSPIITGAAAGSTLGPIGTAVGTVAGLVTSLFGGGGPSLPSAGEKLQIDQWYAAALAGDVYAEAMLRCMSKMGRPQDEALLRSHPPQPPASGNLPWVPADCYTHGWASVAAQAYGKTAIAQLEARRTAGQVGTALIGQSDIPVRSAAFLTSPAGLAIIGIGAYLLLRRSR